MSRCLAALVAGTLLVAAPVAVGSSSAGSGRLVFATNQAPNLYRTMRYSVDESGGDLRRLPGGGVPFADQMWSLDGTRVLTLSDSGVLSISPLSGAPSVRLSPNGTFVIGAFDVEPARPSFSADGRWIVFLGTAPCDSGCSPPGRLFIVRSDGSQLRQLATGVDGAAVSPDGTRVAYTTSRGRLFLVSRSGTGRRLLASGSAAQVPAFSPDGRLVAYLCGPRSSVCLIRLEGEQRRVLGGGIASSSSVAAGSEGILWSPDGERLAILRHGPVTVLPVAGGKPETLTRQHDDWPAAWSPDGSQIAFIRYVGPTGSATDYRICYHSRLYRVAVAGAKRIRQLSPDAPSGDVRWANHRVSFASYRGCSPLQIATAEPDGSDLKLLTDSSVDNHDPTPSPDGKLIAFYRDEPVTDVTNAYAGPDYGQALWIMSADGQHQRRIADVRSGDREPPVWSRDGSQLMYLRGDGRALVVVATSDGETLRTIPTPFSVKVFAWSPDGQTVLLGTGPGVWLLHLDGTLHEVVTSDSIGGTLLAPAWSPGGTRIAFTGCAAGNCAVYTSTPTGGDLRRLTGPRPGDPGDGADMLCFNTVWSPDGKLIAFTRCEGGRISLHTVKPDGTDETTLAANVASSGAGARSSAARVAWSPDSTRVAVEAWDTPPPLHPDLDHQISHITVANPETGTSTPDSASLSRNTDPAWLP